MKDILVDTLSVLQGGKGPNDGLISICAGFGYTACACPAGTCG